MQSLHELGITLNTLLDQIGDLVQVISADGTLLYANYHWLQRLGYPAEELSTYNFLGDVLESPFKSLFQSEITRVQQSLQSSKMTCILKARTGEAIPTDVQLFAHNENIVCIFHEVTSRHHAQTELDRMFAMSVDMLGVANFKGEFIRLNPAWERILGYSLDELLGKPFIAFVHPDDVERTIEESTRSTQVQTVQNFENRYVCKNGDIRWISWHYISYPDMQQTYFVARDITAERSNQELLQEARDQLQGILDNSGTMIGLKNLKGAYILVNQEFADKFSDGDKITLLGKHDDEIFSPEVASMMQKHDDYVQASQRSMQFEEAIYSREGTQTYLTTRFMLKDNDGVPYAICMIAKDITYRKLTEMQLLMRNQAIEHSTTGISIADARLPDMPLIYINPAFEASTGYSPLDVIGRNCRFLQGDDRDQEGVRQMREAIHNRESVTVVVRNYRKDGVLFYNEINLAPIINNDNELTHYVGITTDVTTRIEAQEKITQQNQDLVSANTDLARARQQAEAAAREAAKHNAALLAANRDLALARKEAEDATKLKSQFLATMSHELRTPLNAIIGYTEIQLAGMTGDITDEQRDYQERVVTNAEHLLNLINDVLDISKIEAGRLDLVTKEFSLPDWISDIDSQMRGLAEEKSLEFQIELDPRMPNHIVGDPARIRQVVINLLSNAIKFTETGSVRLAIRKHWRDAWLIIVEDTGIGIPSHMQETIFEEFRQVDSSSRRKVGGTGLGLAIVRKLLLMMGGNVRLSSEMNDGSTFTITLPLNINAPQDSHLDVGEKSHD